MKKMLVPIDFSDVASALVNIAGDWALTAGYAVHLFHVIPEGADWVGYEMGMPLYPPMPMPTPSAQEESLMQDYKQRLTHRGIEVTSLVVHGSPVIDILDEAQAIEAAIIVMGSHRHGMLHHLLLGSVSSGVLKRSTCPVLIVPTLLLKPVEAEHHAANVV